MRFLSYLTLLFPLLTFAQTTPIVLSVRSELAETSGLPFIERESALALNVNYSGVEKLRREISKHIRKPLKFFTGWSPSGEAHVTTITPPEFQTQLSPYLDQKRINQLAEKLQIQTSDLEILGVGSGQKKFGKEEGETFFLIVRSRKLREIRRAIHRAYLTAGGPLTGPKAFRPDHFFPHITIGYTHLDIHESDGLLKDLEHSFDSRFRLKVIK